jgi:hypothetical protein
MRHVAAICVGLMVTFASYGVYATTLVARSTTSFAAGSATQSQIADFAGVTIDAGEPFWDEVAEQYVFKSATLTPKGDGKWPTIVGKTITVKGLEKSGDVVMTGRLTIGAETGSKPLPIELTAGKSELVGRWTIVIQ